MRRVRGVAHQNDGRAAGQAVHPMFAHDTREADPRRRAAQVRRVAHQFVTVEVFGEQFLAKGDAVFLAHLFQAGGAPNAFRRFDDEGRRLRVEAVRVRLKPAPRRGFDRKREGVEGFGGAEPDETALAQVDVGLVGRRILGADAAVQAVGGDDEVRVDVFDARVIGRKLGGKAQVHAQFAAAVLQDVEQTPAADAAKPVTRRAHAAALEVDLDVVPVVERLMDLRRGLGVGAAQRAEHLVRQHDAPAEGVRRRVALDQRDLMRRVLLLHQQRKVQTRRAATHTRDSHGANFMSGYLRCQAIMLFRRTPRWAHTPTPTHRSSTSRTT